MNSKYCYPLVGILTLAASAWAQEAQTTGEVTPEAPQKVTPVSTTTQLPDKVEKVVKDAVRDAQSLEAEITKAILDDSIPLPIPPVIEAHSDGDVEIAPASGNPFFLSFIAGPYMPPENELVDPALLQVGTDFGDARPGNETYAMVMFQKRITDERLETLKDLDCRILGFHPHYTIRVAIPVDRLLDVSTLDFVRWVGAPRTWQKVHPAMREKIEGMAPNAPLDMYVSVFESDMNDESVRERFGSVWGVTPDNEEGFPYEGPDARASRYHSNGWMHQRLQSMGLQIHEYRPDIDTFVVTGTVASVQELTVLDFVQFAEPIPEANLNATPVHDESIPMIMADSTRVTHDGSTNQVAQVGIVDSGVESAHSDIDIFGWGWNCTTTSSPWDDTANSGTGHGTHVTGTILGNGDTEADHTGVAPGLASWGSDQGLYNYRRFPNPCSDSLSTILNTMNTPVGTSTVPHVINNSWSSTNGSVPTGTEANARTVDNHVFNTGQICVWSSGNFATQNVGIEGSAKNALTVGNSTDYVDAAIGTPGGLAADSGRGPLADNRWKPTVNAPGSWVSSAAANNNTGYVEYTGTSMAAPHVTGVVAQLVDHYPFLRDRQPAEIAAILMATAQTHDNAVLTTASASHLDNFGAGRINAYRANWIGSDWNWTSWSPSLLPNASASADFILPNGVTRLVAVFHYNEIAGGAGAGTALVNDFDMYLDRFPFSAGNNTGDYSAQQSSVDNTEIRILNNPTPGAWKWKIWPDSAVTNVKVGLTILWTTADITPVNSVTVTASDSFIQPNDQIDVDVNVAAGDYVSAATLIDMDGHPRVIHSKTSTLQDGIVSDLSTSANSSDYITLGDVRQGDSRDASYRVSYTTEGTKTITMQTSSENAGTVQPSVQVVVDGTQPGAVTNLISPSHTQNQWSNDPTIQWTWNAAVDGLSGIAGYGIFEASGNFIPGAFQDIAAVTSYTSGVYSSSNTPRYFNIRSVDNSGNWDSNWVSSGPYLIDTTDPTDVSYQSSTIPQGSSTCQNSVTISWNAANDGNSGVAGYGYFWSQNPNALVAPVLDTTNTSASFSGSVGSTYYFHIRSVDVAGNWSNSAVTFGPFAFTAECGTSYCGPALSNSTGFPAVLNATGSDLVVDDDLTLTATGMPLNQFGYFLGATAQGPPFIPPGSQGRFCLGGALGRFNAGNQIRFTGMTGAYSLDVPLSFIPTNPAQSVMAGQTWSFQAWFRDTNIVNTSNFSNVVSVTFK